MPSRSEDTDDRIMSTFLRLVAERGIDATTTRILAEEAGVNEVTIFRHFGDKESLARAVFRHVDPSQAIHALDPAIDASSPDQALSGLFDVVRSLRDTLREHAALLQFGLGEYWRFPGLKDEFATAPLAARALINRALLAAQPALRAEVDVDAAGLSLLGLIVLTVIWQDRGWLELSDAAWDHLLEASIRPLLRDLS